MERHLIACAFLLLHASSVLAHPRHTDPILAELNDYLLALQVLRHDNSKADKLFQLWQHVSEESWKIRELTDKQDLPIDAPAVGRQIQKTRKLRRELLQQCLQFFSAQRDSMPTVRFRIRETIGVQWSDPLIETPVGSRAVVLIEIANDRQTHAHLDLFSEPSDQILFWKKSMKLNPQSSRYTFAYAAPTREGAAETTIYMRDELDRSAQVRIRAEGAPLPEEPKASLVPGRSIDFRIIDAETKKPLPVRVEVRDKNGTAFWTPLYGPAYAVTREETDFKTLLWPYQPGPYFYIDGGAVLGVDPTGKTVHVYHGFEYLPAVASVPDNGRVQITLRRWIDMGTKGWYSGHTHVHTTDSGMPVQFSRFWPMIARAEDIAVSNILTLKGEEWEEHAIYADEYPMGLVLSATQVKYIIAYGEEYRNNPYGHLCLLGIDELIQPISSGSLGELGGPDYPPNAFILDAALAQNAATVGAHFGFSVLDNEKIIAEWPATGFEMPVDVALGKMQIAEIYGAGGQLDVWYKLLNCGFELPATGGPDWDMKDTPRTYVYLGITPLTFDHWKNGLKQGKNFVTEGPMIFMTVDGQRPGTRLHYSERPKEVMIQASAVVPKQSLPVEIIVNGQVVAEGTDLREPITLDDSGWIAARCDGAHTSPVYVTLEGRPRGSAKEAWEFIGVIDRLIKWVNTKGLFDTPNQKETVLNVIRQGRIVYESIAERARNFGRTTKSQ